ncbi:MAG: orotidine-5'-phosphate decarboxylase [Parcubacteria group bacterium]|nr:orotidine-5'-phosphate decarboxylase [Parcubacteria group bacterium]
MAKDGAKDRIIVALDVDSLGKASVLVQELAPHVGCFKVGLELMSAVGLPQAVEVIHGLGGAVFCDIKLKDIPNTMAGAGKAISKLGVRMFNVHASAGIEGMIAAREGARSVGMQDEGWSGTRPLVVPGNCLILAVTVLTSFEENNAHLIYGGPTKAKVLQFARDTKVAGLDGVICSPQELELLGKQKELAGLGKVTPGVRPEWAAAQDQKRVMTPGEAIKAGANYLVIGRPITKPPEEIGSPVQAAQRIAEEITAALAA